MLSHRLRRVILYPAYGQVISAEGIKAAASNVPSQTHSIETRQGSKNNMVKLSLLPRVDTKQDRGITYIFFGVIPPQDYHPL